ncbi:hypothetical protein BO85DRAFT_53836 [Aspergillus piperis CBS 112811]|uniref:Uncharacterized protein n=1 Tax=Aspergillus piperis CBS 112811 TaxID=1448313 RepID=A0A8G1VLL7_9EURO|nr:hypothetical protein BO85DRAFT_53836 [Aspergillus piperis CBS 112811]RAH56572.1 hypothetical protein BO85DRAFT_53836 [Aspergillus piperis CBS 112811]
MWIPCQVTAARRLCAFPRFLSLSLSLLFVSSHPLTHPHYPEHSLISRISFASSSQARLLKTRASFPGLSLFYFYFFPPTFSPSHPLFRSLFSLILVPRDCGSTYRNTFNTRNLSYYYRYPLYYSLPPPPHACFSLYYFSSPPQLGPPTTNQHSESIVFPFPFPVLLPLLVAPLRIPSRLAELSSAIFSHLFSPRS